MGIIFTIGLIGYGGFMAVAFALHISEGISYNRELRARNKQMRAAILTRAIEARAPMPLPVPITEIPSWLPISHDDVLLCLSPGMRAEFENSASKDEPSSSSQ